MPDAAVVENVGVSDLLEKCFFCLFDERIEHIITSMSVVRGCFYTRIRGDGVSSRQYHRYLTLWLYKELV